MKRQTTITKWVLVPLAMTMLSIGLHAQGAAQTVTGTADFFGREQQDLAKLPKMERDIVILQNVLNGLFNGERGSFYSSTRGAKGIYVPGKGVIFNIGAHNNVSDVILAQQLAKKKALSTGSEEEVDEISITERNKTEEERLKTISEEFLVNYGSILSELKSGEQVMLNVNYSSLKEDDPKQSSSSTIHTGVSIIYRGGSRLNPTRMVSAIDYSTIDSYLTGSYSLSAATQKIEYNVVYNGSNDAQDAKIMAGILDDLFQSNFDGAFRRSGKTGWTYFDGFGLMYDLNIRGSYGNLIAYTASGSQLASVRATAPKDEDRKSSDDLAEESFDELIDLVKESLITYGRTLRSVKSDEVIILNINFGSSFGRSSLPKAVRLQVSKSQIEAFSKGKKTISQLKKEIDITKLSAGTFNASGSNFPARIYNTAPHDDVDHPIVVGTLKKTKGN